MNEKWFSLSVADIEKKLKTNAALGLNHKAARSRFSGKNEALFETQENTLLSLVPTLLADFSVIIMLIMAVVALCFGERATGGISLFFVLISLVVSLVFYYGNKRYFASAKRALAPRCRVIRQGRLYSVSPRHVVVGDVILLSEGDVVPADARLITSDSLKVKMLVEKNKYLLLDKLAEGAVRANENDPSRFLNMVHAGSVVVGGAARAVVTAVGRFTYAGAKFGNIAPLESAERSHSVLLARLKKSLSATSVALLAASLPVSIASMIFGGDKLSLFSVFMTVISVAFLCSAQLATTLFNIFYMIPARRLVEAKDGAVIKAPYALDVFSGAKYLFLLDGGAVTDGILHLDRALTADGEYEAFEAPSASLKRLSELAWLYLDAKKGGLSVGNEGSSRFDEGMSELAKKTGIDKGALRIRYSTSGYIESSKISPCDKVMFSDRAEKYVLSVHYKNDIISECNTAYTDDGAVPMSDFLKHEVAKNLRAYDEDGKRALVLTIARNEGYGVEGERCFVGVIAFSERTGGSAERAKKDIESRGVKVICFKNIITDTSAELSRIPDSLLGNKRASIRDFVSASRPLSYGLGEIDCYEGFTVLQIEELMGHIHSRGERVVAVGISDKFERIYRAADATVTVSLDKYTAELPDNVVKVKIDPNETRTEAGAQAIRQKADAVIPRYTEDQGGLLSVASVFRCASVATGNLLEYVRYFVLAHTVRIMIAILPMVLGAVTVDVRHLLLLGVLSDMLALFTFAHDKHTAPYGFKRALGAVSSPMVYNKRGVLIFGLGALFSGLLPALASLFVGMPSYIDKLEYSFVSLALFHIVIFLSLRVVRREKAGRLTFIAPAVLVIFLCLSFVGGLADSLDIEGFSNIVYLIISLASPLICGVVFIFFGDRRLRNKGKL